MQHSFHIAKFIVPAFSLLALPVLGIVPMECCDTTKWSLNGSVLYWHAYEQGLGYTNKPADILTTDNFTENNVFNPDFVWEWGFRLGADYTDRNLPWTFQAVWTSVSSDAHGTKAYNSDSPDFLGTFPIWSMGPDTLSSDYVSTSTTHWHLRTNIIDLNAVYNIPLCWEGVSLAPFIGIRGSSLDQKLSVKYEGGAFPSGEDINKLKGHYIGIGPRLGLNGEYDLSCGFSLIGRLAAAPLYGCYHVKQREYYLDSELFHRSRSLYHFVLSADFEIGLRWRGILNECLPCVVFDLAWEGQEFFFANKFYRGPFHFFSEDRSLFLNGLTLNAALDF